MVLLVTTWTQVGQHMQYPIQRDIMTRFHFHSKFEIVIWLIFCIFYRYRLIRFNDVIGCIMIRKRDTTCFMDQNWYLLMLASQGILNSKYRCACVHLETTFSWVVRDENPVYMMDCSPIFFMCAPAPCSFVPSRLLCWSMGISFYPCHWFSL